MKTDYTSLASSVTFANESIEGEYEVTLSVTIKGYGTNHSAMSSAQSVARELNLQFGSSVVVKYGDGTIVPCDRPTR